ASNPWGSISYQYLPDGELAQVQDVPLAVNGTPATTGYNYYQDGLLAGVSSVSSTLVNQPNLYRYSYSNDGRLARESFGASNQSISWSYTAGGRLTALTDFASVPSVSLQY